MLRALTAFIAMIAVGCIEMPDPDRIELKTALENTEKGEYPLVVIFEQGEFVSFQKSGEHKKQYYWNEGGRDGVLRKVANSIKIARKNGFSVDTMGLHEYFDE